MRKEQTLYRMNKLNSQDPMVENIISAISAEMDSTDSDAEQIVSDMFFDTCSVAMLEFYEREAKITPLPGQDIDGRRASVEARWKSTSKVDIEMLQAVADSWKYGKTEIDFVDNKIQITFVDTLGVPKDTAGLELALEEVKPAHLPIIFIAIYLYVRDINAMTVNELQSHLIGDFAF